MKEKLKNMLILFAVLSIPAGFLVENDHGVFWWHHLPFMDAVVGGAGAVILMVMIKGVAFLASKKENDDD